LEGTKLGVLGGTFNPIHNGHLRLAHYVQRLFTLSQIHFVVAALPPHKSAEDLVALNHRYAMVCLATQDFPDFIPSLVELEPPASPFSIDTLAKLSRGRSGDAKGLHFIAGTDSLMEVSSWHESERLLTSHSFVFVSRPGVQHVDTKSILPRAAAAQVCDLRGLGLRQARKVLHGREARGNGIFLVDAHALDISASRIRVLLKFGRRVRRLVPDHVDDYIRKLHLYGEQ
jgi:nicotinate-nucleotide adenylyltransferase